MGFPGSSVVKNLPANIGDTGSIPGQEDPTCWEAAMPVFLSLAAKTTEHVATTTEACAPQQEKPLQWEVYAPQLEISPCLPQLEKSPGSSKDPVQPKIK